MSALDADDLAVILQAHAGLTTTLADPVHFFATAPDDRRTVRWTCSCLASGFVTLEFPLRANREALDAAVRAAGNRHLAEVIAAAIQLSQRGPGGEGGSLASDELAERYVRSARMIVSTVGRIPPPNTLPWVRWRIDPDVLELLQRAGKLQARESAGDCWSELLGIRVEPAIDAQTVPVTVPKALAVRAINAFADTGRGLDAAEMVAAVRRATEMDGDNPTFELVVS